MSDFKAFLYNSSLKNTTAFVVTVSVIIFLLNIAVVLLSLYLGPDGNSTLGMFLFILIGPQLLSLMLPIPGTYPLIVVLEAYLIMFFIRHLTKPKNIKNAPSISSNS